MEAKLIKTTIAEYVPAKWDGTNKAGVHPLGDMVLILPDTAAEKTSGGIFVTDELVYRHTLAAEAGAVIALGDGAFKWNSDKATPYEGRKPAPGDRVCIEKYAGQVIKGDDGQLYRIMESACIGGIITESK